MRMCVSNVESICNVASDMFCYILYVYVVDVFGYISYSDLHFIILLFYHFIICTMDSSNYNKIFPNLEVRCPLCKQTQRFTPLWVITSQQVCQNEECMGLLCVICHVYAFPHLPSPRCIPSLKLFILRNKLTAFGYDPRLRNLVPSGEKQDTRHGSYLSLTDNEIWKKWCEYVALRDLCCFMEHHDVETTKKLFNEMDEGVLHTMDPLLQHSVCYAKKFIDQISEVLVSQKPIAFFLQTLGYEFPTI